MDNRSVFLSLVASVISIIAGSNLTQFALTTVSATNSTILSAAPTNSLTGMPGSLDSAKALLAKAIMDMRSGNTQLVIAEVEAANQTMTQFQQPMQNVMRIENGSNMMRLAEAMKDIKAGDTQSALVQLGEANQTITQFQQAMMNIMNAHKSSSFPLMAAGGNTSQQQSTLLMNTKRPPSPLMTGGSGARNQQETQNMLSILNNINSHASTTAMGANNHITAKK